MTLKGAANIAQQVLNDMSTELAEQPKTPAFTDVVKNRVEQYFTDLEKETPANVYNMVLAEVEKPLIEIVLKVTNNNQSKAAIILGLSRGTLRKKMAIYNLNDGEK